MGEGDRSRRSSQFAESGLSRTTFRLWLASRTWRRSSPPPASIASRLVIPERVVFERLGHILVFGCAYWRIADESCSATTLRRVGARSGSPLGRWTRCRGWCSKPTTGSSAWSCPMWPLTAASPRLGSWRRTSGQKPGRSRKKRGIERSTVVDGGGIPLRAVTAPANRHGPTLRRLLQSLLSQHARRLQALIYKPHPEHELTTTNVLQPYCNRADTHWYTMDKGKPPDHRKPP